MNRKVDKKGLDLIKSFESILGCIILVAPSNNSNGGLLPMELFAIALYCRQTLHWRNARVKR